MASKYGVKIEGVYCEENGCQPLFWNFNESVGESAEIRNHEAFPRQRLNVIVHKQSKIWEFRFIWEYLSLWTLFSVEERAKRRIFQKQEIKQPLR